jgi:hypothetical protein
VDEGLARVGVGQREAERALFETTMIGALPSPKGG